MGFDTYTPQRLLSPKNGGPLPAVEPAVEPDRFDYPTESNGFMARAAAKSVAPTETAFYEGPLSVQQRVYDEYNFRASAKPDKARRWFLRRHWIFSKADQGCVFSEKIASSITPEAIAIEDASLIPQYSLCLDAFSGVGGNSISMARMGYVIGVESSQKTIRDACINSRVYGVSHRVDFIRGDAHLLARCFREEVRFDWAYLSPPWGNQYRRYGPLQSPSSMSVDLIHVIRICRRLSKVVQAFLPYNMDLKPVIEAGMTEASSTDPWALETLLDRKKVTVDVCQPRNKRARTQSQPAAQLVHLSGRCPFCHYSAIYSIQTYVSEVNVGLKFHFGAVASKSKTANLHYLTDRANVRRQLLAITAQWSDQPPMTTGFEELVDKGSGEAASAASAVLTEDGKDEGELPLLSDAVPGRNAELVEEDHCKFIQV